MIAAVHITKSTTWRGQAEEFENVYHYDTPAITTDSGWDELIDAIVTAEKSFHSSQVNFVRARVHGPTNTTKAEDIMRRVKDLSGTGSTVHAAGMPREITVVCQIYMGRGAGGRKSFLRKYWHTCFLPNGAGDQAAGNTALPGADKTFFQGKFDSLKTVNIGAGANQLCKPNGDHIPSGTNSQCLDYLHIRQFRR